MDYPKIFSEQFPHDMGPWITEKSESGLKALLEVRKLLVNNSSKIDKVLLDDFNYSLYYAICQMSTLYNFSLGTSFDKSDADLIFDRLDDGFEEMQVKYGLLDKTSKQIEEEDYNSFITGICDYLEMEQVPGRTLLQGLLDSNIKYLEENTFNSRLLHSIESSLYKVANGELAWTDFVIEAKEK
jgi:hypothetical protein